MTISVGSLEPVYTLKQAAQKFFPDGTLTVTSLRNEIRKGRLRATMPAGKLLVTESALVEMLEACRVVVNRQDCGSSRQSRKEAAPLSGSSLTDRDERARDAANKILSKLNGNSQSTSE